MPGRLPLFAFLTGLHLALLQFSYFFLLLINVTSTYITYATVVISWMAGTLLGLLWGRLSPWLTLALGVGAYYATGFYVVSNPLSATTLPIAAIGVVFTGLWAGHFFVVMLPMFTRADRLFLHENNGFLLGVVGVFIGFTMLGQRFLLATPLVSGLLLLAYWNWLSVRPPLPTEAVASPLGDDPLSVLGGAAADFIRGLVILVVTLALLLPAALIVDALLVGRDVEEPFTGRDSAVTFLSSVQLVLVGLLAYGVHASGALLRRLDGAGCGAHRWAWLVVALAFVLLAVEERAGAQWGEALIGDVAWMRLQRAALLGGAALAVVLSFVLLREFRRERRSLWYLATGLALSMTSALIAGAPEAVVEQWLFGDSWKSVIEAICALWGQLFMLLCVAVILDARFRDLHLGARSRPENSVSD